MIEKLQEYCSNKRMAREVTISDCELEDIVLSNLRADRLCFSRMRLSRVNFNDVQWRNSEMIDVSMDEVNFNNATLRMCKWKKVHASNCNFSSIKFENSEAQGCEFDNANFENASLFDSDLSRSSLRNANLEHAVVTGLNLRGADLTGANCDYVDFSEADLRGADFRDAKLDKANLQGADIRGAIFDPHIHAVEIATEAKPIFSPQMQEVADSVGPLVANMIKKGKNADVFSNDTQARLLKELQGIVKQPDVAKQSQQAADKVINSMLHRAGNVGIDSLLDALRDDNDTPSKEIAKMLQGLTKDLNLKKNATTEDLLAKLIKSMK